MVLLYPTGDVLWIPRSRRRTLCSFHGAGAYICNLKFGSWVRHSGLLMPKFYKDDAQLDVSDYMERNLWDITMNEGHVNLNKYNCCEEIYPDLFFNFTMEKKEGFSNSAATILVDTLLVLFSGLYCCLKRF